ncbi:hypothetical protein VNO80_25284 [Phaseolus coccineus]|uniref:Uncharacterized protein n=1 Tax=Phaseolus coccineus TaxID=3886 RepID=A0AAN9QQ00_PHACN
MRASPGHEACGHRQGKRTRKLPCRVGGGSGFYGQVGLRFKNPLLRKRNVAVVQEEKSEFTSILLLFSPSRCDSGTFTQEYDERQPPLEPLGSSLQLWRVGGGSYEWASSVKKNELGLLYELTLSYRESDNIEIIYAHAVWISQRPCVDFTVVWYDSKGTLDEYVDYGNLDGCI